MLTYGLLPEEVMKSLTAVLELDSTIPTIWSPRLEQIYQDILVLSQFGVLNTELLDKPGSEVEINRLNDIGPAVDMDATGWAGEAAMGSENQWSGDTIVETAFTTEQIAKLIPTMKFKAVKFTQKALIRSFVNVMNDVVTALAHSHALKREMDCFNAISSGSQVVGKAWGSMAVGDTFNTDLVKDANEIFEVAVKMNSMAYFPGNTTVCILHPHQARDLTDDSTWFDVVKRAAAEKIFRGELVEWDGVRFIKSTVVKFYAGGSLTNVGGGGEVDMAIATGLSGAQRRWYFSTDGTYANKRTNIQPRYQFTEYGTGLALNITLDATDANAKVINIDYRNGFVEFDVKVGGTNPPTAKFTWGAVPAYESILIGRRAFAIADKQRPRIVREIRNYGLFHGFGASSDYDVKKLNDEQIVRIRTAG